MAVSWVKDVDAAFGNAKSEHRPVLLDFSAVPAWSGCVRLEAESYGDPQLKRFIEEKFIPSTIHIKENPAGFHRFDVLWTPTVLIFDENGKERFRIEGYLPKDEFAAHLLMGLARVAFMNKKWTDAEQLYNEVVAKYPEAGIAPAAVYWLGVSRYKKTNDHHELGRVVKELKEKYPGSPWNKRAVPWAA